MQNIIDQILILLKATLIGKVSTFYQGDPLNLQASMFPLVYVEANGSETSISATGLDAVTHTITIGLIFDLRSEMGGVKNENVGNKTMIKIMEDREANGQYSVSSIAGILRTNFTLNESANNQLLSLKYALSKRNEVVYEESRMTFRVTEFVPVPQRT